MQTADTVNKKKRPKFPSGYKTMKKRKIKSNAIKHDEKVSKIKFTYGKFLIEF
jgi:hypothetical protein